MAVDVPVGLADLVDVKVAGNPVVIDLLVRKLKTSNRELTAKGWLIHSHPFFTPRQSKRDAASHRQRS